MNNVNLRELSQQWLMEQKRGSQGAFRVPNAVPMGFGTSSSSSGSPTSSSSSGGEGSSSSDTPPVVVVPPVVVPTVVVPPVVVPPTPVKKFAPSVNGPGPVALVYLAMSEYRTATNPRGWNPYYFPLDANDPDYNAKFREKLLAHADLVIANCKKFGAKRVIVWDIEGQELDHWESYIGDPRILPPEMSYRVLPANPTWDEFTWTQTTAQLYFKKFVEAGIKVGGTVRPTTLRAIPYGRNQVRAQNDKNHGWQQVMEGDYQSVVSAKIAYAAFFMQWTEVYFDSSVREWAWIKHADAAPIEIEFYKFFKRTYPNVCIHPEFGPRKWSLPNVQPWIPWTEQTVLPSRPAALALNPYTIDMKKPEVKEKLFEAARKGYDFMIAGDQPLVEENIMEMCKVWREGYATK